MPRFSKKIALLLATSSLVSVKAASPVSTPGHLPPDFLDEPVTTTLSAPTSFAIDPEGNLFLAERAGKIFRLPTGTSDPLLFLDLSSEIAHHGDLGLLAIALDPDFLYNGFLYASYAVATAIPGDEAPTYLRVVRYSADPKEDFSKVVTGSLRILLGVKSGTGPAILAGANPGGALAFGTDGSLLVGTGDGASPRSTDAGSDPETDFQSALQRHLITEHENLGAFRAQSRDSRSGKILRLDPESGAGLPTNPYFDPANPNSPRSQLWSLGLRNPFRIAVVPGSGGKYLTDGDPGTLFIGDVGWATAEEINVAKEGARNFGWPLYEGLDPHPQFARLDTPNPDAIDPKISPDPIPFRYLIQQPTENPNPIFPHPESYGNTIDPAHTHIHHQPILGYRESTQIPLQQGAALVHSPPTHSAPGSCSIAGTWFDGLGYPAPYRHTYFHADLRGGWIQQITFDQYGTLSGVHPFLSSNRQIIQIATHPTEGILYYLDHDAGELRRIRFTGDLNLPPLASSTQSSVFGPSPLTVQFDASPSSDPENAPLKYHWDFGDGQISTDPSPSHHFTSESGTPKSFPITLIVTDPKGLTSQQNLTVSLNNTPPKVRITSIGHGDRYEESADSTQPTTIPLRAEVTDSEHAPSELTYRWQTILHHNKHTHDLPPDPKPETATILPATPCGFDAYAYRIQLTVTDPAGLSTTVQTWLYPNCPCLNRATAEVWRLTHFETDEQETAGQWLADPDSDHLPNLLEYALGQDPKTPSPNPEIYEIKSDTADRFTLSYDRPEWQPDLVYTLELSPDAKSWTRFETPPVIQPTAQKATERVTYENLPAQHARLRIDLPKTTQSAFAPPVFLQGFPLAPSKN